MEETKDILTKKDNYKLYFEGKFGNKLNAWSSLEEYKASKFNSPVGCRYQGLIPGQYCVYDSIDIEKDILELVKKGADPSRFIISERADDSKILIQGEVSRTYLGLTLFYSHETTTMRKALQNGISSSGLEAKLLLQKYFSPASYDDIMELLDTYQDHVVEFTTFSNYLGDCNNRNTVIWEVRKY
jgi:hypothetical protein